jgi:hypothetical protein
MIKKICKGYNFPPLKYLIRNFTRTNWSMSENSEKFEIDLSENEWRMKLSKEQFKVLREKGTERAK